MPIKPDVMISCHYKNKDFAMKIKSDIEKLNLVVWISVEKIRGLNLTSVNSAIKNIECILICITKEYEVNLLFFLSMISFIDSSSEFNSIYYLAKLKLSHRGRTGRRDE